MPPPDAPRWSAPRLALRLTLVTGAATVVYRLGRPVVQRLRQRFGREARHAPPSPAGAVTLAHFHRLHEGMSEDAVIELLGSHYREVNGSVTPLAQTRTLRWTTEDTRGDVHAVFQNGRLVAKDQRGL